jgi:hypothetical protein
MSGLRARKLSGSAQGVQGREILLQGGVRACKSIESRQLKGVSRHCGTASVTVLYNYEHGEW